MKISIVASSASSRVGIALRQKRKIAGANSRYKSPQAWVSPVRARTINSNGSVFPGALIRPGLSGSIVDTHECPRNYHKLLCTRSLGVMGALSGQGFGPYVRSL